MTISLAKRIQGNYRQMTPKQRRIAEYLSEHYDKAVFQTAKQLAAELGGVSEATIIRFALSLGYSGYPEMVKALSEMVRTRITTVDRLNVSLQSRKENPLQDVMQRDIANIKRTVEELDLAIFQEAVTNIAAAKRIYVLGFRSAVALSSFLHFYLQILLKNCTLVHNADTMFDELVNVGSADLVIGISFARYTRQTVEGMGFAKERGASTMSITDSHTSPLAVHSDTVLLAQRDMSSFIDSFVAPLSLINALILAVGQKHPKQTKQTLTELEELWTRHKVYYEE